MADRRTGSRGRGNGTRTKPSRRPRRPSVNLGIASVGLDDGLAKTDIERAANLLKEYPLFRNLSRRLLIDLVERSLGGRMGHSGSGFVSSFISEEALTEAIGKEMTKGQILAIVVLKGTLIAASKPAGDREPFESPLPPNLEKVRELPPGVYSRSASEFDLGNLRLEPPRGREVDLLVIATGVVLTPAVAWQLDTAALYDADLKAIVKAEQRPELIWIAAPSGSKAPAEALTHVLAGKIATEYPKEPAALVMLGDTPEVLRWQNDRFMDLKDTLPKSAIQKSDLTNLVGGPAVRGHVYVLNKSDMLKLPTRFDKGVRFDRVVYLADEIPQEMPPEISDILVEGAVTATPGASLSSFIPSISAGFLTTTPGAKTKEFKAGHLPRRKKRRDNTPDDDSAAKFMRCVRDSCFVPMDVGLLDEAWRDWLAGGGTSPPFSFLAAAVDSGAVSDSILGTWGRAVTNRRVGVASSGGGASAYRLRPLLARFESHTPEKVPVDVFVGLSGSALIGAFYSRWGLAGLDFARDLRFFFQATMPLLTLWTYPYEVVVDCLLERARVEDVDIRFAAVAAALPETERPRATVVVKGTLGEAVRASGTLPPSFAPTDKDGIRYTDGGAGTAVPAQVARDCGADVVLACNVIPGPKRGNPFGTLPLGRFIHNIPLVGRLLDGYMWNAFFWSQTSEEFGDSADVYVDFDDQVFPMIESSYFMFANWIIAQAESEGTKLGSKVEELYGLWKNL